MKNRNWTIIVLILGFILGYEWFVVRPQMKKQMLAQQAITKTESPTIAPVSTGEAANPTTPKERVTAEQRSSAIRLAIAQSRTIRIFPNGGLGDAEFGDYSDRLNKDQPVRLDTEGWLWSSNDPAINACLASLAARAGDSSEQGTTFVGESGGGQCELRYETVDTAKQPGLLKVRLSLSSFPESLGYIEFGTRDRYGKDLNAQDHKYLGFMVDGSRTWVKEKNLLETTTVQGRFDWIAWGDKYFGTILMPKGQFNPNFFHGSSSQSADGIVFGIRYPLSSAKEATKTFEFNMFVGARSPEILTSIDPALIDSVDFGWFGSVARALLWMLKKIHLVVGNWGISIIVLTLLVRLAFWPLNRKVYSSGQKMKLVQPEMERIKAKYANDKSKADQMNREVMELYRKHQVNPLGGCLPVLAQMPIFIGLWSALSHAIELYQTQFLWIHDLSSRDPYYIFPALWTVTLLLYARLTPQPQSQPGMPDMKWVMIIMNLVFGFLSKDWPAGLTLYLFVSNLVGITQQWLFQRAAKLQPIREGA